MPRRTTRKQPEKVVATLRQPNYFKYGSMLAFIKVARNEKTPDTRARPRSQEQPFERARQQQI
jgi:hypothetical protein